MGARPVPGWTRPAGVSTGPARPLSASPGQETGTMHLGRPGGSPLPGTAGRLEHRLSVYPDADLAGDDAVLLMDTLNHQIFYGLGDLDHVLRVAVRLTVALIL